MDDEHKMLAEAIENNRMLLISIKDEMVHDISTMKLVQQKLKYMIYAVAAISVIGWGKPELLAAIMGMH